MNNRSELEKLKPLCAWLDAIEAAFHMGEILKMLAGQHREIWANEKDPEVRHLRSVDIFNRMSSIERVFASNMERVVGIHPLEPWSNY